MFGELFEHLLGCLHFNVRLLDIELDAGVSHSSFRIYGPLTLVDRRLCLELGKGGHGKRLGSQEGLVHRAAALRVACLREVGEERCALLFHDFADFIATFF